jgi:hypothetical protein
MGTLANLLFPGATQDVTTAATNLEYAFIVIIVEIAVLIWLVWESKKA